jgi:hypothetical protein
VTPTSRSTICPALNIANEAFVPAGVYYKKLLLNTLLNNTFTRIFTNPDPTNATISSSLS